MRPVKTCAPAVDATIVIMSIPANIHLSIAASRCCSARTEQGRCPEVWRTRSFAPMRMRRDERPLRDDEPHRATDDPRGRRRRPKRDEDERQEQIQDPAF